jgi:hypothetical protein
MNGPVFETEIDPAELFNMFFGGGGFGGGGFGGQPSEEHPRLNFLALLDPVALKRYLFSPLQSSQRALAAVALGVRAAVSTLSTHKQLVLVLVQETPSKRPSRRAGYSSSLSSLSACSP